MLENKTVEIQALKERTNMLENKISEAGFSQQFELEYMRKRKDESIPLHKKNIEAMATESAELQEYVKQHFNKQRKLKNCEGEQRFSPNECKENNHVLS